MEARRSVAGLALVLALCAATCSGNSTDGTCALFLPDDKAVCQGNCIYGASGCYDFNGKPFCICNSLDFCPFRVPRKFKVCGSDGNWYRHRCQLNWVTCLSQKPVRALRGTACPMDWKNRPTMWVNPKYDKPFDYPTPPPDDDDLPEDGRRRRAKRRR